MEEQSAGQPVVRTEHRRGVRFPVVVPVEVKWQGSGGESIKESAEAKEVNTLGGLLEMKAYPRVGSELELTNLLSGEGLRARVVGIRESRQGKQSGVAVELLAPSDTFWGVNFQLKKTSAELVRIEETIKSGGVEPRILVEFRDAVDYVRKTAWAVQEWQERQLRKHDTQTLLPLITTERVRRATQLSNAIMEDLAAHEVTRDTAGMEEFFRAVQRLYQRVVDLFQKREG